MTDSCFRSECRVDGTQRVGSTCLRLFVLRRRVDIEVSETVEVDLVGKEVRKKKEGKTTEEKEKKE